MRLLLDTCVVIDLLTDVDNNSRGALELLEDWNNQLFASTETMREIVVHFNKKALLSKYWKTSEDVLRTVEKNLNIEFLPITSEVGYSYSRLLINEEQEHRDPSDHVIISHAMTERMTLISSDTRFPYYRDQGLDLIEY
ncbi:MAG: type II toxin-antitoxin system VapC family toxin [Bacteroidaceae bacterium]|nr:type II toxin-antitoxin system VapC family toxin [Bacteroidaceae bacterium]